MKYFITCLFLITISCCLCASQLRADEYDADFVKEMTPGGKLPEYYENVKNRVNQKYEEQTNKISNWLEKTKKSWIDDRIDKYQFNKELEASERRRLENLQIKADKLEQDKQYYPDKAREINNKISEVNHKNQKCLNKATYSEKKACLDALRNDSFVRGLPETKGYIDARMAELKLAPVDWTPLFISDLKAQDGCITAAENYDKAAVLKNADNAVQQYEYLQKNCGDDLKKLVKQEGLNFPSRKNGSASNALFKDALSGRLITPEIMASESQNSGSDWNIGEILEFGLKLGGMINQFKEIRSSVAPVVNTGVGGGGYCPPDSRLSKRVCN